MLPRHVKVCWFPHESSRLSKLRFPEFPSPWFPVTAATGGFTERGRRLGAAAFGGSCMLSLIFWPVSGVGHRPRTALCSPGSSPSSSHARSGCVCAPVLDKGHGCCGHPQRQAQRQPEGVGSVHPCGVQLILAPLLMAIIPPHCQPWEREALLGDCVTSSHSCVRPNPCKKSISSFSIFISFSFFIAISISISISLSLSFSFSLSALTLILLHILLHLEIDWPD